MTLDSLFRFLFEYRPVIFQQGEFRLAPTTGLYIAAAVAVAAVLMTINSAPAAWPSAAGRAIASC